MAVRNDGKSGVGFGGEPGIQKPEAGAQGTQTTQTTQTTQGTQTTKRPKTASQRQTAVEIRGLKKAFGGLLLYDDFSFAIDEGVATVLTGPSGCGKTTLLRMIAGLEEPDGGTIRLWPGVGADGGSERQAVRPAAGSARPSAAESAERPEEQRAGSAAQLTKSGNGAHRKVIFVFQEDRLLPWLTVKENMQLVLPRGTEKQAEGRIEELLHLLELSEFGEYYPEKLSGGMRQRVSIGRALLYGDGVEYAEGSGREGCRSRSGGLLLMDEPFKGLDDALKFRLMTALAAEWKRRGCTVVLVTHDRQDAGFLGDRLWEFSGQPATARLLFSR